MVGRTLSRTLFCCLVLLLAPALLVAQSRPRAARTTGSAVVTRAAEPDAGLATIFSNLGPSATDLYDDAYGYYVTGPTNSIGISEQWIAIPFTPKKNSTVTQLRAAIGYESGTSAAILGLYSDSSGVVGTALATVEVKTFPTFGTCCTLAGGAITATSVTAGTQYWIVATSDDTHAPTFGGVWMSSNSANIGGDVALGGWFTFNGGVPAAEALGTVP